MIRMFAYQALPSQTSKITKRYCRNLVLAVAFVVIITVILTSSLVSVTQANDSSPYLGDPTSGSHIQNVISGSIVLNPNGYYFTGFYVPGNAKNAVLQGNFTVARNSTNNAAVVTIWSQPEFINYLNCKNASPCYNKGMFPMASDNINVTLPSGQYIILIGSATVNTNILQAQIDLTYNQ